MISIPADDYAGYKHSLIASENFASYINLNIQRAGKVWSKYCKEEALYNVILVHIVWCIY